MYLGAPTYGGGTQFSAPRSFYKSASVPSTITYSKSAITPTISRPVYAMQSRTNNNDSYSLSMHKPLISQTSTSSYAPTNDAYNVINQTPEKNYTTNHSPQMIFSPAPFLNPQRSRKQFINCEDDVLDYIKEAFTLSTGKNFPTDVSISICNRDELMRIHDTYGGQWSEGIQGFAINRCGNGQSEIFIRENPLDELMLTIGHEIGHIMSQPLETIQEEEAKAFSFSMVWMDVIKEHNIADLQDSFVTNNPAHNGIHDVALSFVDTMMKKGMSALDVFTELIAGNLTLEKRIESML